MKHGLNKVLTVSWVNYGVPHALIIYSHFKIHWSLEKKSSEMFIWNHSASKCNANQACRPNGHRKLDWNTSQRRVIREPGVTNETVPRTLNSLHGDKILIVNRANQQRFTEDSNHSQEPGKKVGELFLWIWCNLHGVRRWATKRRPFFQKRNRPCLKGAENSHSNGLAAVKSPGTFYKHTHKTKEGWARGELTQRHIMLPPHPPPPAHRPLTFSQSGKQTPLWTLHNH